MGQEKGFTLIEIVVTAAIIGIIAAIALPSYEDYIRRSRITDAFNNLLSLRIQMERYAVDKRNYGSNEKCGVPTPNSDYFSYVCNKGTESPPREPENW